MKKALHKVEKAFLFERNGQLHPEEPNIDEILTGINRGLKGDWGEGTPVTITLREVYKWICRYLEEGATEALLNELNADLHQMHFYKYVLPPDFYSLDGKEPQCLTVANMNYQYSPKTFAANEFSRIITTGMLKKIKRCQLPGCENLFLGPPQAKWCSKTCGSKHRVRQKRRRDSE